MELQFAKNTLSYLRRVVWEIKNEEQTQEVKLGESLPDIGRILGAWGQPLIRSKDWRGSSMSASGGVMAWILYAPEEGSLQCVQTWIPFQTQWDFSQTQHDAAMQISVLLKEIDARSVSARKIMVRAILSIAAEAMEPVQAELFEPLEIPEDIQLLQENYPVCLAVEAGEKLVTLDEEWSPGAPCGPIGKVLHCHICPEILDQKVMADKVVFRGSAKVHMLCMCEGEQLQSCRFEIPFSQYAELEKEYQPDTTAAVIPAVTNLEVDIQENGAVRLKAGIVGQYVIYDRPVLRVVTDAYSVVRTLQLQKQQLELPAVLDRRTEVVNPEMIPEDTQVTDAVMYFGHPSCGHHASGFHVHVPAAFHYLGRDAEGNLNGGNFRWEKEWEIPADGQEMLLARSALKEISTNGCKGEIEIDMFTVAPTDIPMITALDVGDTVPPDANRPSLILRTAGTDTLWEIAKATGSTMETIRQANGLTGEPQEDQMLIIPIP